jgi:RNA polymerase sigma factor (sigma-70 family)
MESSNEELLYLYSEFIAKRYFKFYKKHYINIAYDLDDLKQEAKIVIWKVCDKYKDKPFKELKKITCKAVGNKLSNICKYSQNKNKIDFIEEDLELSQNVLDEVMEQDFSSYMDYDNLFSTKTFRDDTLPENLLTQPNVMDNLFLEELKALCSSKEVKDFLSKLDIHYRIKENIYDLLYCKYVLDHTYEEIGIEFGITRQRTDQIFKQILLFLKKYF